MAAVRNQGAIYLCLLPFDTSDLPQLHHPLKFLEDRISNENLLSGVVDKVKQGKTVFIDVQPDAEYQYGQHSEMARRLLTQNSFGKITNRSGIDT